MNLHYLTSKGKKCFFDLLYLSFLAFLNWPQDMEQKASWGTYECNGPLWIEIIFLIDIVLQLH